MKPSCHNRPDYHHWVTVQDGWVRHYAASGDVTRLPKMITLPDNMSKGCQQWGPLGEATIHGWDCSGCRHKPNANEV